MSAPQTPHLHPRKGSVQHKDLTQHGGATATHGGRCAMASGSFNVAPRAGSQAYRKARAELYVVLAVRLVIEVR